MMCVRLCQDGVPPRYAGRDRWSALPSCGDIVAHMQHTLAWWRDLVTPG